MAKLVLYLEQDVIDIINKIAVKKQQTMSQVVENFFKEMIAKGEEPFNIDPNSNPGH
ncbi:DUF6364 family protein [Mucilaginibacter jinjuensis]|uniref:DUF6364 family protein n=1 Tax=Mucilaginibacter jinjuensis TaxID=1176721 RepID=A0ABY7T5R5_9SPHI|nr:DUF6364 family protein [Mucilaginibacter jinjuensis]WCT11702.1 DUF6364 family protein [Mucilaginibacter jinjuensis]